jgi:predicted dehydrogenase
LTAIFAGLCYQQPPELLISKGNRGRIRRGIDPNMAANELRIGVLGAGHLGRIHLQQWREVPGARVVGFFDPHPEKCAAIEAEFGFKPLQDQQAVIEAADVVDVVTPTRAHLACATAAMEAGKHAFIEKPLASSVEEGRALLATARKTGAIVQVGHVERFNPAFLAARHHLRDPDVHRDAPPGAVGPPWDRD